MVYIYCTDIYCTSCGEVIMDNLKKHDFLIVPVDPLDESSYDSDEYPKWVDEAEESDCPQHCGSREKCLEAIELPSGQKIGALVGELTEEGIKYLREAVREGGEVAEFWAEAYADYL